MRGDALSVQIVGAAPGIGVKGRAQQIGGDQLPTAGRLSGVQRDEDADGEQQPRRIVGRDARGHRQPAGSQGHKEAGGGPRHHVMPAARSLHVGPPVAPAAGAGIDEPGVSLADLLVAEPQLFHDARAKVVDQHVGLLDELQ